MYILHIHIQYDFCYKSRVWESFVKVRSENLPKFWTKPYEKKQHDEKEKKKKTHNKSAKVTHIK